MLFVRITDGLGNQMFQYAMARALEIRWQEEAVLNISHYQNHQFRHFQLDRLNIKPLRMVDKLPVPYSWHPKIAGAIGRLKPDWLKLHTGFLLQKGCHYQLVQRGTCRDMIVQGFWQSEEYFRDIATQLREELQVRDEPDAVNARLIREISDGNSICLHVRRGDYLSNPWADKTFAHLDWDYYRRGLEYIAARVQEPRVYVFSDDPAWARENIRPDLPVQYMDKNQDNNLEDLRLMYSCRHFVIANSTFSWWGAWLAREENKIVIAPRRWFEDPAKRIDILPPDWLAF